MTKRKDRFIHCRLSNADFERFHANAERLELTPSVYLRYLIRMPVGTTGGERAVVLDTGALSRVHGELVRWGHHYNQAVHALNTVALFVGRGSSNVDYYVEQMQRANRNLEAVRAGEKEVARELRRLEGAALVEGDS
ncbi:hypothetical protein [Slackia isoflavoniconvertens]|uniref:hypothetical protein n=1 Tax=Slackia isoflavoniconvertens TaxID=572010 RepID=UPI003F9D6030